MTRFYYAVTVEGDEHSPTGQIHVEPTGVVGQNLGKEPDWCCDGLKDLLDWDNPDIRTLDHDTGRRGENRVLPVLRFRGRGFNEGMRIGPALNFCPFCASPIVYEKHLDLKVVNETVQPEPHTEMHYVVVNHSNAVNSR